MDYRDWEYEHRQELEKFAAEWQEINKVPRRTFLIHHKSRKISVANKFVMQYRRYDLTFIVAKKKNKVDVILVKHYYCEQL
jgi:hypothetical protein